MVIASAPTRSMYADYLGWRGVRVREVASAVAALEYLSTFTPDAAVIEERLTDASGFDLVRTLRRCRATAVLPIALLSSDVFRMNEQQAKARGCDTLLVVPCLPEALLAALVELVQTRAAQPRDPPPDRWLFVGREACVLIMRTSERALRICGPGQMRREFAFPSELELVAFQVRHEERLVDEGYALDVSRTDRRTGRGRGVRGPDRRVP
jgi:DNA-binding response OmpR family regulator